jgi:predicted XRE-type DNA-binding protein
VRVQAEAPAQQEKKNKKKERLKQEVCICKFAISHSHISDLLSLSIVKLENMKCVTDLPSLAG